jgi:hypothetical protein
LSSGQAEGLDATSAHEFNHPQPQSGRSRAALQGAQSIVLQPRTNCAAHGCQWQPAGEGFYGSTVKVRKLRSAASFERASTSAVRQQEGEEKPAAGPH